MDTQSALLKPLIFALSGLQGVALTLLYFSAKDQWWPGRNRCGLPL
ncbi:hypothetical protein [Aestuariibacter sp. A3R04]|nr:hypothetical protein [Aestuariibacter sp. A3R04]MBU3020769.1 hypothetical protein [Aestuariibacter sp. A3R04]